MGDFDRDGDVDMDDEKGTAVCQAAGQPIPPLCEILDMNRDNVVNGRDAILMQQECYTGRAIGAGGGDLTSLQPLINWTGGAGLASLEPMVNWTVETLTSADRIEFADAVRDNAVYAGPDEAQVMNGFADAIDPTAP